MTALRTLLKGLGALATLAAIVVGMPWLLYRLGGSPIPSGLPTSLAQAQGELTRPDNGTWLIGVCKYLGWAAWVSLTGSILRELLTQARHIHLPRVPVFIGAALTARLVAAVLAIGALSTAATVLPAAPAVAVTTGNTQVAACPLPRPPLVTPLPRWSPSRFRGWSPSPRETLCRGSPGASTTTPTGGRSCTPPTRAPRSRAAARCATLTSSSPGCG